VSCDGIVYFNIQYILPIEAEQWQKTLPTCISFATFGPKKSTLIFFGDRVFDIDSMSVFISYDMEIMAFCSYASLLLVFLDSRNDVPVEFFVCLL
jgi:hypothetical protein